MLDSIFGKQPRSYWLQALAYLVVWFIALGILTYPLLDVKRNTEKPASPPGEAKIGGYRPAAIVNYLAVDDGIVKAPHCLSSIYRETGPGLAIKYQVGEGGFTAPWLESNSVWSCQ